ncbi:MAG: hypothetical protein OSJ69_19245 [Acetatifactor sp.]|nr:hypothetical protein [Acetatifactor sp.]
MYQFRTIAAVMLFFVCLLTGCSSSLTMSLVFSVETGDQIKVTVDCSEGLKLKQTSNGFAVTKGENDVIQAFFVGEAMYQQYLDAVAAQEGVTVNQESSENGITYLSYSYEGEAGTENNFIVWIDGASTGVVAGSLSDLETATKVFHCISFSKE